MPDRVALVTGASRGLGRAIAEELGARGIHVLLLARTEGGLEEVYDQITAEGGEATIVPLDLADGSAIDALGASVYERWGKLDILVNAAAHAVPLSPVGHISPKDVERAFAVNAHTVHRLIRAFDPLLMASEGAHVVFVVDDKTGRAHWGAYAASKFAGEAFAEAYAEERLRSGIRVTVFRPPAMPTALRARFYPGEDRSGLISPAGVAAALADRLDL